MPITLYVDTQISGQWRYHAKGADPAPPNTQPYLTRLAWIVDDGISDPLVEKCHLIEIPAVLGGGGRVSLSGAMEDFANDLGTVERAVAYGWKHHSMVLDHSITYRLGWPAREWPTPGDAMVAAVKLARQEEATRDVTHHMTAGTRRQRGNLFMGFEAAAVARGLTLDATLDPALAGYQRVWAVRAIWTAFEELNYAAAVQHEQGQ